MTATVLVPVLSRPLRAARVHESLRATGGHALVFVATGGDTRQIRACQAVVRQDPLVRLLVLVGPRDRGDYARKINEGARLTGGWLLQGADDLRFHPGWYEEAMRVAADTGCRVIGTNDLCNPRTATGHSTHSLVHASYIEDVGVPDEPGCLLHTGYWHNFVDDELIRTARVNGEYAHAPAAHVEHLHPNCAGVKRDATYQLGLDPQRFREDRRLYHRRNRLVLKERPVAGRRSR